MERGGRQEGDHVALVFPPGIDLSAAFYGCLYAGCVPITVRRPHPQNISTTLPTVKMIVEVSHSACVMTTAVICKLLRSKEAMATISIRNWPPVLDSGFAASAESERDVGWGRVCVFLKRLGKKADSRSLSLAHCDPTATDLLELATLLQFLPQVEEMDISWNELIGGSLMALTSHLQHVGEVRTLRLCSCRLNSEDVVGEALSYIPALEVLNLSLNSGVGGGGLQGLLGNLHPSLRELHLMACRLTAADATVLGGMVAALPRLCVLDVSCNAQLTQEVDTGGFRELVISLSRHLPHHASTAGLRSNA